MLTTLESFECKYGPRQCSKHPKVWDKEYAIFQEGWLFGVNWEKENQAEIQRKYTLMSKEKKK